jgi:hypothetical protein
MIAAAATEVEDDCERAVYTEPVDGRLAPRRQRPSAERARSQTSMS